MLYNPSKTMKTGRAYNWRPKLRIIFKSGSYALACGWYVPVFLKLVLSAKSYVAFLVYIFLAVS